MSTPGRRWVAVLRLTATCVAEAAVRAFDTATIAAFPDGDVLAGYGVHTYCVAGPTRAGTLSEGALK